MLASTQTRKLLLTDALGLWAGDGQTSIFCAVERGDRALSRPAPLRQGPAAVALGGLRMPSSRFKNSVRRGTASGGGPMAWPLPLTISR